MSKIPFYRTRTFNLLLGLAVSTLCLWWAVREMLTDENAIPQMISAFQRANYWTLPLIFAVLFVFYWIKAWRWRMLLAPIGRFRTMRDLFPPIMIGFAFNNLLPAHLGEFVRCYVFSRRQNLPMTITLSSVVLERIFDVIAILFYMGIGLLFIKGLDPAVQTTAYVVALGAVACVGGGLIYVVWTHHFIAVLRAVLNQLIFIPHGIVDKVCQMLGMGAEGLSSLKDVRLVFGMLMLSLIKWGFNGSLVLISLWAFGITVPPMVAMVVLGVVAFGVTIPSSPGYFGVIQLCFMMVLKLFVEDRAGIFAASIYYHLSQWVPVTLVGMLYFLQTRLSIRHVEDVEEHMEEGDTADVDVPIEAAGYAAEPAPER